MKTLLVTLALCAIALGDDKTPAPKALTETEQLTVARGQIAELRAELDLARAQLATAQARASYDATVKKQREAHAAPPGCDLTTEQGWTCPPEQPKK